MAKPDFSGRMEEKQRIAAECAQTLEAMRNIAVESPLSIVKELCERLDLVAADVNELAPIHRSTHYTLQKLLEAKQCVMIAFQGSSR